MLKKAIVALLLTMLALLCGCAPGAADALDDGFFIWMEGYHAAEIGSYDSIALTYYHSSKAPSIKQEDIIGVRFDGIEREVTVTDYSISELETGDQAYRGFGLTLDIEFDKKGVYQADNLRITSKDGDFHTLPIGSLVFDIGEAGNDELLDTWSSPGATSNADSFTYDYKVRQDDIEITAIIYDKDKEMRNPDGIDASGTIDLSDAYRALIKYIKPKIELTLEGKTQVVYSKMSCYCGAIVYSDDLAALSREYRLQNNPSENPAFQSQVAYFNSHIS